MASIDGHDYVEIAGVKWASMDVGSSSIYKYGDSFQWGDTAGYKINQIGSYSNQKPFKLKDYKFNNGYDYATSAYFTKYTPNDSKLSLDMCDDSAVANWGGGWRMPTLDEMELLLESTNSADTYDGHEGILLTDKTDSTKKIFFPGWNESWASSTIDFYNEGILWQDYLYCASINMRNNAGDREIYRGITNRYGEAHIRPVYGKKYIKLYWKTNVSAIRTRGTNIIEAITYGTYDGTIVYTSSDPSIVSVNGNQISGVSSGTCIITATIPETDDHLSASTSYSVICLESDIEFVDLGLPSGTVWAKTNVGASSETDYGDYYQYGNGIVTGNTGSVYRGTENPLASSADTATRVMGSQWHMPTQAQFNELTNNTRFAWVTDFKGSGVNGGVFTAQNGKYVFFPTAGYMMGNEIYDDGNYAQCWTSNNQGGSGTAICVVIGGSYSSNQRPRQFACSIRGVIG